MTDVNTVLIEDPPIISLMALSPHPSKTPWWARRAGLRFTHLVLATGGTVWDQPIDKEGSARPVLDWWLRAECDERTVLMVSMEVTTDRRAAVAKALMSLKGRRGQPVRSVLRHLRLWPRQPWNCISPSRKVAQALGFSGRGETPDDFIEQLVHEGNDESMSLYLSSPD